MRLFLLCLLSVSLFALGDVVSVPNTFSDNTVADAADVNENFEALVSESNENDTRIGTLEANVRRDDTDLNLAVGSGLKNLAPDPANDLVASFNTAVGLGALDGNTTGYLNTAVGLNSLLTNSTGNFNSAFGNGALNSNESGSYNTALGSRAAYANTTGSENTAIGREALRTNTTGSENTASGYRALHSNTTGLQNTASGVNALYSNTEGNYNNATGYTALYSNTTGVYNNAMGRSALYNNTTGQANTASGERALFSNTTGSNNTAIGNYADVSASNLTNATAIGYEAKVDASHKVRIGNDSVTVIGGAAAWSQFSDERLKENIEPVDTGLSLITDLKPVVYHRINNDAPDVEMGLLAQEVEAVLEKHGLGNSGMVHHPTEDSYMSLRYNDLLAPMIKAIQELDEKNQALTAQLKSQQKEFLAIVQSQQEEMSLQQERLTQLQQLVEHQFVVR